VHGSGCIVRSHARRISATDDEFQVVQDAVVVLVVFFHKAVLLRDKHRVRCGTGLLHKRTPRRFVVPKPGN
jgi:hypothetical protein